MQSTRSVVDETTTYSGELMSFEVKQCMCVCVRARVVVFVPCSLGAGVHLAVQVGAPAGVTPDFFLRTMEIFVNGHGVVLSSH